MLDDLIARLAARLPELEWKLGLHPQGFNPALLPRGLFRNRFEVTIVSCIDEVKADLETLKGLTSDASIQFLAEKIAQKINVLVRMGKKSPVQHESQASFGVQAIHTRQQWLKNMQKNIDSLIIQHQALVDARTAFTEYTDPQARLNLEVEIGKAEQHLTLARETLNRSTKI